MADILVYIYEPDSETYATAEFAVERLKIINNVTSLPIYVYLSQSPSDRLTITFYLVFNEYENAGIAPTKLNDMSVITLYSSQLEFYAWDEYRSYTIKVQDWNFDKGRSFRLYIRYSGINADSFTDSAKNSIKFNILETSTSLTPTIAFIKNTLETNTYSFSVQAKINQMGYSQLLVLPEGQQGPETGQILAN